TFIGIPYFGRKVINAFGATLLPGKRCARQREANVARTRIASAHAKLSPMQRRVPPPNGKYQYCGLDCLASAVHLSGSKRFGAGKNRASRCGTKGLSRTIAFAGTV